jgi:hypothetical protein
MSIDANRKDQTVKEYRTGNSQLLQDYREALIKAYGLGEDIKETYGIVPPKVITDTVWQGGNQHVTIGLTLN